MEKRKDYDYNKRGELCEMVHKIKPSMAYLCRETYDKSALNYSCVSSFCHNKKEDKNSKRNNDKETHSKNSPSIEDANMPFFIQGDV